MSRLPLVSGDNGTWGSILNDFLGVSLNSDGTIKTAAVGSTQLASGAVTSTAIAAGTIAASNIASGTITTTQLSTGVQTSLGLANTSVQQDSSQTIQKMTVVTAATYAAIGTPSATTLYVIVG